MKKERIKPILGALLLVMVIGAYTFKEIKKQEYHPSDIDVVLSLEDNITKNSIWCGTFNLLWNDLKEEIVKQEIVFHPQTQSIENLNKGTFTKDNLKESSYIKKYGLATLDLKKEIEEEIKKKWNETSTILDDFEWTEGKTEDYFLYTMLKKEFQFPKVFTKLEKGNFKNTKNVKYFGIDNSTNEETYNQVNVLYYNNENEFAILLKTQEDEEIILLRGAEKTNFKEIWDEVEEKSKTETKAFTKGDTLKVPYLNIKLKNEFTELEKKIFTFANGEEYWIEKALQTISFDLNEQGGKLKSEAGMHAKNSITSQDTFQRKFHFDKDFVLFLKEKEKELPYFAANIDDIEKFS